LISKKLRCDETGIMKAAGIVLEDFELEKRQCTEETVKNSPVRDFIKNLRNELNLNHGMRVKLSLLTFRLGFLFEFLMNKKFLRGFIYCVYKFFWILCNILNCGEIPPKEVFIDWGLRVPHGFMGVAVNRGCRIGKNCTLYHNTTIGAIEGEEYDANMLIGDNVYIGVSAIILGNVKIGDSCKIGAGTMVINKNISDNTTVINEIKYREIKR
jgi:serine O-acetyltransferase